MCGYTTDGRAVPCRSSSGLLVQYLSASLSSTDLWCLNRGEQQLLQGLYVHSRWKWPANLVLGRLLKISRHGRPRHPCIPADYPDTLALRTEAQYLFDLSHWYPPIGHVAPLGGWF